MGNVKTKEFYSVYYLFLPECDSDSLLSMPNFVTFIKDLFAVFRSWFCPTLWWTDRHSY